MAGERKRERKGTPKASERQEGKRGRERQRQRKVNRQKAKREANFRESKSEGARNKHIERYKESQLRQKADRHKKERQRQRNNYLANTLFTSAQGAEVLGSFGDDTTVQTKSDSASGLSTNGNIEEHLLGDFRGGIDGQNKSKSNNEEFHSENVTCQF